MTSQPNAVVDPWARALGCEVVDLDDQRAVVALVIEQRHLNFLDGTHGGVVFSLAEFTIRTLAQAHGAMPRVGDIHLSLTSGSAAGDTLSATATRATGGRRLATYRVSVVRGDGRTVGEGNAVVGFSV